MDKKLSASLTIELYDDGQVFIKPYPDDLNLVTWLGLVEILKVTATDRAQTFFPTLPAKAVLGLQATGKAIKVLSDKIFRSDDGNKDPEKV